MTVATIFIVNKIGSLGTGNLFGNGPNQHKSCITIFRPFQNSLLSLIIGDYSTCVRDLHHQVIIDVGNAKMS